MESVIKHIIQKINFAKFISLISLFLVGALPLYAQSGYGIGQTVSDFQLKNIDGRMLSLNDNRSVKGYILVFTCNHCPFSKAYDSRIVDLHNKFASKGYPVIAINPNDPNAYEEDSFANMRLTAPSKGFTFPYLQDETQSIAKAFGATRTPSCFVLKREGDRFTVQYIGAIDDNSQDPSAVNKKFVEDAVNNLLSGRPVMVNNTKAVGCAIKWKNL